MNADLQNKWSEIVRINHDVPAIQAVDAEIKRLREDNKAFIVEASDAKYKAGLLREGLDALQANLRIFIHAHETGNSVPPFVVKDAEECCRRAEGREG